MSMRHNILGLAAVAIVATVAFVHPALAATSSGDTVIAIVNGDKITKKDVDGAMKTLQVPAEQAEKVFPQVVDQIINEKLITDATTKAKIEDSATFKATFKESVDAMRSQLIKKIYIEDYLKDKITDKMVEDEYNKYKTENTGKEEVHARHILVPTEEEAKQVLKDLEAGAVFEDLAKKRSSGPTAQNGGDLGFFAKEDMIPEFSNAAFLLKPGTYAKEAVKTQFGWHVIRVEERRMRPIPPFKEVEGPIRNNLGQAALQKLVTDLRAKADIKRFDASGKPVVEEPKKN